MSFEDLPNEIVDVIFSYLDEISRIYSQRVCRLWFSLAWTCITSVDCSGWYTPLTMATFESAVPRMIKEKITKFVFDQGDPEILPRLPQCFPNLTNLEITSGNLVYPFRKIGAMPKLQSLKLDGVTVNLGSDIFSPEKFPSLTELSTNCGLNTDSGISPDISLMTNLTRLHLGNTGTFPSGVFWATMHMKKLTYLRALGPFIPKFGDPRLRKLPSSLRTLILTRAKFPDCTLLKFLRTLSNLRELDLSEGVLGTHGYEHIADITQLESLNINRLSGAHLATIGFLNTLTNLTMLKAGSLSSGNQQMRAGLFLVGMSKLEHLSLEKNLVEWDSMSNLTSLRNLTHLNINNTRGLNSNILTVLNPAKLQHIHAIGVRLANIPHNTTTTLADFTLLETLKFTDNAPNYIRKRIYSRLLRLKTLCLAVARPITTKVFASLQNLETLLLPASKLTDNTIKHLSVLTSLKVLHIEQCPDVTPKSISLLSNVNVFQ